MVVGVDATVTRNRRGYGRFARNAIPALVAADRGTRYVLYVDRGTMPLLDVPGAETRVVEVDRPPAVAASGDSRRGVRDMLRFARAVRGDRPDAVLFTSLLTYVPVPGVPLVVGLHDAIAGEIPGLVFPARVPRLLWKFKERDAIRRARRLFTVSESARAAVATGLGVEPTRLAVVPEAPDPVFTPAGPTPLLPLPSPDAPFILCAAGGISPHKNVETLLDAYALLDDPPALVVVGALGDETYTSSAGAVRERARALGIGDRVVFPGFVADDVLAALYRRAVLVVNPSLAEGFGLTAVEAAACGAAVVLSDLPAHRETLGDAAAFFAPRRAEELAERLRGLLADEARRTEVARRCREAVAGRTWATAGARLAELVHDAARG